MHSRRVITLFFILVIALPVSAQLQVIIDKSAAEKTLKALGSPAVTIEDARSIALLPGNQAIIRKMKEMGSPASTEAFATALQNASAGRPSPKEYGFDAVLRHRNQAMELLSKIESTESSFLQTIENRIQRFSPPSVTGRVTGYLVAGGPVDGFSFSEPAFYLDLVRLGGNISDAKQMLAHELFHGVQNLATRDRLRLQSEYDLNYYSTLKGQQRSCYAVQILFANLLAEGTALLVGDGVDDSPASSGQASFQQANESPAGMAARIDLLDALILAGTGAKAIAVDRLYGIGFYSYFSSGRPALYDLAKLMASEIAAARGEKEIGVLAASSPSAFVRAYQEVALKKKGEIPALGRFAQEWAQIGRCQMK